MNISILSIWIIVGILLVFAEFIVPGLISVFIGLGALTVALLLYFQIIENIASQFLVLFISSTVYIFSLRLLVMRYYPSNTEKFNVDEESMIIGQSALVIKEIPVNGMGRIQYGESTWNAISNENLKILKGEKVTILKRSNISWIVTTDKNKES